MAACASPHHLKIQNQATTFTTTAKPKRRKCRDITVSSSAAANPETDLHSDPNFHSGIVSNTSRASSHHQPPMEFSYDVVRSFPSSFTKFNSALTAGLLNPMSPPPPPTPPQTPPIARSSPTLFDMMVNEPDPHPQPPHPKPLQNGTVSAAREKHFRMQQRLAELLGNRSPGNMFNDSASGDIRLTLTDKDGFSVSISVHRQILAENSAFFAGRLSDRWTPGGRSAPFEVEISDCDDVEVYVETLRLMYCKNLRKMLIKEDVSKVLGILKISAAIGFDAGVFSCLEYLEAAPWAEDEEERITSLLTDLHLESFGAGEVLKRVYTDYSSSTVVNGSSTEEVLKKLLQVVLEGKDDKARREMKGLFLKMLRESVNHNDISKESLYIACEGCLQQLRHHLLQAAGSDLREVSQVARQADNLHWLLDILIDRQIAEDFVKTWASQLELSRAHPKVPSVHRYEVSRVTARLFVGIGKGQLLASKDSRCLLLKTWLNPFYDDFGWMRRASKGLDRHLIEDGLSNTILTLPMSLQQDILLAWFDRFLNSGEDCPNIQRGFEVWWRRAFWKRNGEHDNSRVRITNGENP